MDGEGGAGGEKIRRKTGSVQWMTGQHVVIRQDKINSHGGSQRAGSPPVVDALGAGADRPRGSRREQRKGGKSGNAFSELLGAQFTEQQSGVTL